MVRPYRTILSAAWAVAIASTLAAVAPADAETSGPVFRADGWQADEYGRGEGYPASTAARSEQKKSLIGSYSRWDELVSKREITTGGKPAQLARAPREPTIRYVSDGLTRSLDDYLNSYPITGLLIARGDRILVERYQYDRRDSDRFQSQSMAKTILALLIGIAVNEGKIKSLADTADSYVDALRDSEYGRTPLKALLQMSSGMRFKHGYAEGEQGTVGTPDTATLNRLRARSVVQAVLQFKERAVPPGTRFNYTSADNLVLGLVLAAATGQTGSDYASEKLWGPLGAERNAVWRINRNGEELTACCFGAILRDYARLGLMLANDGKWQGRQIVPQDWLVAATSVAASDRYLKLVSTKTKLGYGYQTWLLPEPGRMFLMRGFRGQELFVDPRSKTVMVQTAVWPIGRGSEVLALWRGVLDSLR